MQKKIFENFQELNKQNISMPIFSRPVQPNQILPNFQIASYLDTVDKCGMNLFPS